MLKKIICGGPAGADQALDADSRPEVGWDGGRRTDQIYRSERGLHTSSAVRLRVHQMSVLVATLTAVFTCLWLSACSGSKPLPFSMKQDIPLGVYKLRVLRLEIDTLKRYLVSPQQEMSKIIDAGHSSACVLFKLTPASPPEAGAGKGEPVSPLLSLNYRVFSIIDATGKKFPARLVLPSKWASLARDQETTYPYNYDDFESAMREMSDPKDFVVAFSLPKGTSGLTLLISNPFPKEGQPKVAAVQLGR